MVLKHINSPMTPDYMKYLLEHDTVLEQVLHVVRGHGRVDVLQHHRLAHDP